MTQNKPDRKDEVVRIDLTEPQKEQVKKATGKDVDSVELRAEELEERIAPALGGYV
jgi:hypothetical protein